MLTMPSCVVASATTGHHVIPPLMLPKRKCKAALTLNRCQICHRSLRFFLVQQQQLMSRFLTHAKAMKGFDYRYRI